MVLISMLLLVTGCKKEEKENPFLTEWETPFGTPPFDEIKNEHYLPAFKEAITQHNKEIDQIINNTDEITFENTIEALDYSGSLLKRVNRVFNAMKSAMNNDELVAISKEIQPKLTKHKDDINLNEKLFEKVKYLYGKKESLELNTEQNRLLEKYYKEFVRGGVNLDEANKEEFRKINKELSLLSLKFGENVLIETNKFELIIDNEQDLDGLPEGVINAAFETAKSKGYAGKWVFTIHKPSMIPFL